MDPEECDRKQVGPGFTSFLAELTKVFFKVWSMMALALGSCLS